MVPMSASAVTNIFNPNRPPTVNAGPDQTVSMPAASGNLDGTADVLTDAASDRYGPVDLRLSEPLRDGLLQGFHSASNLYVV